MPEPFSDPNTRPPAQPYPTRNEILRLVRDVLDQKPAAIKLLKAVASQFQVPTLEAANNMARAYLDNLASDGK